MRNPCVSIHGDSRPPSRSHSRSGPHAHSFHGSSTTMQPPNLEVIAARPAVCRDQACILDVLLRITPSVPDIHFLRPPINLGIVLDRSVSMSSGKKRSHSRKEACFAI